MAKPYLSIIVPAYNEARRITNTLVDIDKHLAHETYSYEIIVVNDGSTDNTAEVVRNLQRGIRNLRLIDNQENKGKGGVVKDGMLSASGTIRLFTDADNSTSIDHINRMIPEFKDHDVVICSRSLKGSVLDPAEPLYRQIPGKIGNLIIQILLLPGLWDTQCGFKAFSEESALKIFPLMKISRWGFDVEALALAKALGYKIKEVPVHWVNDPYSHVSAATYLQFLLETFRIRWWLWRNAYGLRGTRSEKHDPPRTASFS
jgi:dolichyl-phosphate beta-glucosyltransferase